MLLSPRSLVLPLTASILVAACGGGNAASQLAKAPDYQPQDQTKCGVEKSQAHPLVVEWPSSDRLQLETMTRQGLVAVQYVGCVMQVLERCSVPARYNYLGGTRKQDELDISNEDELYANLPVGAAGLEGKLQRSGKLTVKMDLVGRYQAEKMNVRADELQGDCASATHFIYGVTVGAFDFYAGGQADVGASAGVGAVGAGARSQADRESITRDGDPAACEKANPDDKAPPAQCGALIRIEVFPISAKTSTPAAASAPAVTPMPAVVPAAAPQAQCVQGDLSSCATQCDQKDAESCATLGWMYEWGKGVAKDEKKAEGILQRACDGGSARACNNLGSMYEAGSADPNGVQRDFTRALPLFKKGCAGGNWLGCTRLGVWSEMGLGGLAKDPTQAFAMYKRSCDLDANAGCAALGHCYEKGVVVPVDTAMAARLYKQTCQGGAGDPVACNALKRVGGAP